jgi:hypothetical protein
MKIKCFFTSALLLFTCMSLNAQNWKNPSEKYKDTYKKYIYFTCPIPQDSIRHFVYFSRDRELILKHSLLFMPRFQGTGDIYLYRSAETYLLKAEAYFWKGQLDKAAIDINTLRDRSNADLIVNGDVNLGFIFDERACELYSESIRHAEMVRASYIMASLNLEGYPLANFSESSWWYDRV